MLWSEQRNHWHFYINYFENFGCCSFTWSGSYEIKFVSYDSSHSQGLRMVELCSDITIGWDNLYRLIVNFTIDYCNIPNFTVILKLFFMFILKRIILLVWKLVPKILFRDEISGGVRIKVKGYPEFFFA